MAGFFGLFDYTKEGPGVSKNEKKKKGFFHFFEVYFRNFWSYAKVGPLYWLCSLLVATNGMAKVGLTHVARSTQKEKHSFLYSDFFESIKKNWKQALILGVINVVAMILLAFDIWYFWNYLNYKVSFFGLLGLAIAFLFLVCTTFMKYYIWTLLITFNLKVKQLIKNSFNFVFLNLWRNILISVTMGIIYVGLAILSMINAYLMMVAAAIMLFVVPGFKAALIQANAFSAIQKYMIDPYYAEHKGEDIEKRLALGLNVSDEELALVTPTEESIFSDNSDKTGEKE